MVNKIHLSHKNFRTLKKNPIFNRRKKKEIEINYDSDFLYRTGQITMAMIETIVPKKLPSKSTVKIVEEASVDSFSSAIFSEYNDLDSPNTGPISLFNENTYKKKKLLQGKRMNTLTKKM